MGCTATILVPFFVDPRTPRRQEQHVSSCLTLAATTVVRFPSWHARMSGLPTAATKEPAFAPASSAAPPKHVSGFHCSLVSQLLISKRTSEVPVRSTSPRPANGHAGATVGTSHGRRRIIPSTLEQRPLLPA